MIELAKEKTFTTKDERLQVLKSPILFESGKNKFPKFTCCTVSAKKRDYDYPVFLAMNNGLLVALILSKQKSLFYKHDKFIPLTCKEEFKHKGCVNVLLSEVIDGISVLFSGGVDGTIKMWNTEFEEIKDSHYIKTIFGHKGSVLCLSFSKSKSILASSASDKTIKIWKMDENFDKVLNPLFHCINTLKDFPNRKLTEKLDNTYWISTLSLKETDKVEVFAGDTRGYIHHYQYVDSNMEIDEELRNKKSRSEKVINDNFNYLNTMELHKLTLIKIAHSVFDAMIYSIGFDGHLVGYNVKEKIKYLDVSNSNKSHFTALSINFYTQELLCGDEKGGITFIKIFNKSESRIKTRDAKILYVKNIDIFPDQQHLLVLFEDICEIYKIKRETKILNVEYHDAEIIKVFVIEPVKKKNKIVEDAKIITAAYDNKIKVWDFLSMESINVIEGPDLKKKNSEISTVCHLPRVSMIAVATDVGRIFFWDLNKSQYIKNNYEIHSKHKSYISCIINVQTLNKREFVFSADHNGIITYWELEPIEMKLAKPSKSESTQGDIKSTKHRQLDKNYINKLSTKELNELMKEYMEDLFPKRPENKSKSYDESCKVAEGDENSEDEREKKYMYLPTIKHVINTVAILNAKEANETSNSAKHTQNANSNLQTQNDNFPNFNSNKNFNNENNNNFSNLINLNFNNLNNFPFKASNSSNNLNNYQNTGISGASGAQNKLNLPAIRKKTEISVLAYSPDEKNSRIIYSGGADTHIHLWDIETGNHIETWKAHKRSVISMCFDGYYLLTGGEDGVINVWNTFDRSLLFALRDNVNDIPMRIKDLYMLSKFGILIAITGEKKINFWRYQTRELLKSVINKKECLCIGIVESYGKILFGTKDRTIVELDMAEVLDSIGVKHGYNKAPFMNEDPNYETDPNDPIKVDNFKIMDSLIKSNLDQ